MTDDAKYTDLIFEVEELKIDKANMNERIDAAYTERNRLVSLIAHMFPSGIKKTAIEGWDDAWHNCVFVHTPEGQMSWHYHDKDAALFADLPPYPKDWDGHTTEEKYVRMAQLSAGIYEHMFDGTGAKEWPEAIDDEGEVCPNCGCVHSAEDDDQPIREMLIVVMHQVDEADAKVCPACGAGDGELHKEGCAVREFVDAMKKARDETKAAVATATEKMIDAIKTKKAEAKASDPA